MLAWISFLTMLCGAIATVLLSRAFGLGPIAEGLVGITLAGGGFCLSGCIKAAADTLAQRKLYRKP